MVTTKQLEDGKILSLILNFSGPAVVGMIVQSIYNIVDRIYIGHSVGSLGLAGIALGFPIMMLVMALSTLVGMGATALISLRLGEKKPQEAEKIMGNAFAMLLIVAAVVSFSSFIFLHPLLNFFGASEATMPYAYGYMRIITMGMVFQMVSFGCNNFIRAQGNPQAAMYSMLIGAISNIILDPIFIFALNMGVEGAAIATVISKALSTAYVMHFFMRKDTVLRLRRVNLMPDVGIVLKIIPLGLPMSTTLMLNSLVIGMVNNRLVLYGGDMAISAYGIIHSFMTLLIMPVMGISQGIQPIIGYNYGARQFNRVKETLRLGITIATSVALVGFISVQLFPEFFIRLFTTEAELIRVATLAFRLFFLGLPVVGFQMLGGNYFQAVGKPIHALFLNLTRQGIFFLPMLFILPPLLNLNGVYLAQPAAGYLAFFVTITLLFFEMQNLSKKEEQEKSQPYVTQEVWDTQ